MGDILKFQINVPEEIALQYANGREIEGRYGPQMMFSLADGRVMYVPPIVGDRIAELSIAPLERFTLTKQEVKNGRKSGVQWVVQRVDAPGAGHAQPQAAQPVALRPQSVEAKPPASDWLGYQTAMLSGMLCASIDALSNAKRYGASKGFELAFNEEDVRATAMTLYIQSARRAA